MTTHPAMTEKSIEQMTLGGHDVPRLPLWPENLRGAMAATLRSALFAPVRPGARLFMQREQIAAVGDLRIIFTGFRLDQADFEVYDQVLHLARQTTLGKSIKFNILEMLRALGRTKGKSDCNCLLKSLSRLSANEIDITNGKHSYAGSLIQEQGPDEAGMHYIILNPKIMALFG